MNVAAAPKRRRWRGCLWGVLVVAVLMALGGAWAWRLWKRVPAAWTRNQAFLAATDNATLLEMADNLEKRLLAELTDPGLDGTAAGNVNQPRTIHVSMQEVNAWLAVKLPTWAANRGAVLPPEMSGYMVASEGQDLVVAFQYQSPRVTQVISVVIGLDIQPTGQAELSVRHVRGGELPLPPGTVVNQVKKAIAARSAQNSDINAIIDGRPFDPLVDIDAARRLRLLGYRLDADGADVTIRTELRGRRR
jgi:hypothetical protein